jgi:hypothetical protein
MLGEILFFVGAGMLIIPGMVYMIMIAIDLWHADSGSCVVGVWITVALVLVAAGFMMWN